MRKRVKWILFILVVAGGLGVAGVFVIVPAVVDAMMNKVTPVSVSPGAEARRLHETLFVADLHADSLLWNRDMLAYNRRGHVDVPRLVKGNVALQAFTVVTKTPKNMNYENNSAEGDNITTLVVMQRWPRRTWSSLFERALYQAERFHDAVARSDGALVAIESRGDLEGLVEARKTRPDIVGGFLGIEGLHCLEGKLENVDRLYEAGFRMMGITHFFDNELGGSAHGERKAGLTDFGKKVVAKMEERKVLVDLAHASPAVIDDVLAMATRPVINSHTGVKGTCDRTRNLSDDHVRGIAATGGVIGIGYWDEAVCGESAEDIAKAIKYTADLAGVDHVALGSDYDGAITAPFDTANLVEITAALQNEGFSEEDTAKIMGGNVLRLLQAALPPKDTAIDHEAT
jgi:microsomal dipeptidase-like Zn-dependent dipeptidase